MGGEEREVRAALAGVRTADALGGGGADNCDEDDDHDGCPAGARHFALIAKEEQGERRRAGEELRTALCAQLCCARRLPAALWSQPLALPAASPQVLHHQQSMPGGRGADDDGDDQ